MRGVIKAIGYDGSLFVEIREGNPSDLEQLVGKDLSIDMKPWHDKRSSSANALLWHCIGQITVALNDEKPDKRYTKWDIYLNLLRKHGKYAMISVREDALDAFLEQNKTCVYDDVGKHDGFVDLLYYFGSSTYDSKEFSVLLDGCIDEMKQMGLPTPTSEEMKRAIAMLERREQNERRNSKHDADCE